MEVPAQLVVLQLLLFVLPPCHSDTLHRLLRFLSKVAQHAKSSWGPNGQEVRLAHKDQLHEEGIVQTLLLKTQQSFVQASVIPLTPWVHNGSLRWILLSQPNAEDFFQFLANVLIRSIKGDSSGCPLLYS